MANSDVRAAMATLDSAIQALSLTALQAAAFTSGKEGNGPAFRFHIVRQIDALKNLSTATVAEFASLLKSEQVTGETLGSSVPQG